MALRDCPTLESMLADAKARLGSHTATMKALGVSRQRLYSAAHGGPPLRVARVLKLGLIANTPPIDALRAGQQHEVAALLEEALTPSDSDITPIDRALLRAVARLPPDLRSSLQQHIDLLLAALDVRLRQP